MRKEKNLKHISALVIAVILFTGCAGDASKEKTATGPAPAAASPRNGMTDLASSKNLEDILCQCWDNKQDAADAEGRSESSKLEFVYRGFCFFKDGNVTTNPRGNIRMGKWLLDKSSKPVSLSIAYPGGQKERHQLAMLTPYVMKLSAPEEATVLTDYTGEGVMETDPVQSPFYPANNRWRIRPAQPESDLEIKERLKENLHFFVLFYDHMIRSAAKTVSFSGFPSCFRWYSGGVFLQKKEDIPQQWIDCFYNQAQAMKAYAQAEKLMTHKYEWPKNEHNWLKLNVAVLKQMEKKMDSVN